MVCSMLEWYCDYLSQIAFNVKVKVKMCLINYLEFDYENIAVNNRSLTFYPLNDLVFIDVKF